jgi:ribosomal protein S27E
MKLVNRYTRAGADGKSITCPECNQSAVVYHFSWFAIECWHCGKMVDKHRWMVTA